MKTKTKIGIGVLVVAVVAAVVAGNSGLFKGALTGAPVATSVACPVKFTAPCTAPYHKKVCDQYSGGKEKCVWSCGEGTTPDQSNSDGDGILTNNPCVCKPGLIEVSTDQFGRRVCATQSIGVLQAAPLGSLSDGILPAGNNMHVLQFQLTAKNEDVEIRELNFQQTEPPINSAIQLVKVYAVTDHQHTFSVFEQQGDEQLLWNGILNSEGKIKASLNPPVVIPNNGTKLFRVRIDMPNPPVSGATLEFDLTSVSGAGRTSSTVISATGVPVTGYKFQIIGDQPAEKAISVRVNASLPSRNISQGLRDVILAKYDIKAGSQPVEIQNICFDVDAGLWPWPLETDIFAGTLKIKISNEVNVYSRSWSNQSMSGLCSPDALSAYFKIPAGQTETVSLITDIASTAQVNATIIPKFNVTKYALTTTNEILWRAHDATSVLGNPLKITAQ